MTVDVKICGVRTPAILDAAVAAGANFVGLVFFEKSPRHLTVADARALATSARGHIKTVAVMVNPDDALVDLISAEVQPDVLQLHGSEAPERVATIKERTGRSIFKAIPVFDAADLAAAPRYAGCADQILFDAKAPAGSDLPGGNGISFDWRILEAADAPFAVSGGLDADNVAEAIRLSGAALVDVSSGVETAPGVKDERLISTFIHAARSAPQQHKRAS